MVNVKDIQKFNKLTFTVVAKMLSWYTHAVIEYLSHKCVRKQVTNVCFRVRKKIPFHYLEETFINILLDQLIYKS